MDKYLLLFWLIAFLFTGSLRAGDSTSFGDNIYVKAKMHYGFILPHHSAILYNLEEHVRSYELNVSKPTFGNSYYERLYNYPRIGLGYYYGSLGNRDVFGKMHAFYPYIHVPLTNQTKKVDVLYKIAFGFSYLTKKFDLTHNFRNIAIGSHLNIYFNFGMNIRYKFNKQNEIYAGLGFIHASNGNYRKPNLGLNTVSVSAGYNYLLNDQQVSVNTSPVSSKEKSFEYAVVFSGGMRRYSVEDPSDYFASSLILEGGRHLSWRNKLGVGVDVFYNEALEQYLKPSERSNKDIKDKMRIGWHVAHDVNLNRLAIIVHLGTYLATPYPEQMIFERVGLRYRFSGHWIGNFSIKAHYADADFVEWGIGYVWK